MTFDVVFTGPAPHKISRATMIAACSMVGIKARTSFCSKTRIVVAPYEWIKEGHETSKLCKAREQGCDIIPYGRFISQNNLSTYVL